MCYRYAGCGDGGQLSNLFPIGFAVRARVVNFKSARPAMNTQATIFKLNNFFRNQSIPLPKYSQHTELLRCVELNGLMT